MILATLDLETDPFEYGKFPKPFVAGFYDGTRFISIWGADCITRMTATIRALPTDEPYCIYAHNGGKFDFIYFLPHLERDMRIVNNRIIQANIGMHQIRDSFAILPFPLREYNKDEIDYEKMRANVREKHRTEIVSYLKTDCTSLHELVSAFHAEFGDSLTIGGSALKQLKKRHAFKTSGKMFDDKFREHFYFGGRVQVFESGIIDMPCRVYDVNSMYPFVMKTALHPVGVAAIIDKKIRRNTCFVVAEGFNHGSLPIRHANGSLDFTSETGRYCTTIHEWNAAEATGGFRCKRIVKTYGFDDRITFDEFVNHFYSARKLAKSNGDKIHTLFYKFVLNSAYGKFAQNPENFADYQITTIDVPFTALNSGATEPCGCDPETCSHWSRAYLTDDYCIWSRPSERKHYYNICTGASITGAARALLMRGLHDADRPIYCDTDSIICRSLRSARMDSNELGAWKLEGMGNRAAIAGKKLYCIFDQENACIKKAHKGAILTPAQIVQIARGESVTVYQDAPSFKLSGKHTFQSRTIRKTA